MTSINQVIDNAAKALLVNPDWRWGQCLFNALSALDYERAETIRGTVLDPFYDDSRVDAFLAWVGAA